MICEQIIPPASLSRYVHCFWALESRDEHATPRNFTTVADGYPGLVFQEDTEAFRDTAGHAFPQLFLHGMGTRHSEKSSRRPFRNLKVDFQPSGLRAIFGLDAHELADSHVGLDALVKTDLRERLLLTSATADRIGLLCAFFLEKVRQNRRPPDAEIDSALDLIRRDRQPPSLGQLRMALGLSERSLERKFRQSVGVPPKLFSRIIRFQVALKRIRQIHLQSLAPLTEIAYDAGYADQSHFIRECKQFTGAGPGRFKRQTREQVENFPEWDG